MIRFSKLAAALAVVSVLTIGGSALADSPGQLATGPYVYRVKNVTTNGTYASTANASACDVVQYTTELNNGGFGGLTNIIVKASLPSSSSTSIASTVTATPDQGASFCTTGTATVNFSSNQSLNYVNGSTQLLDVNGKLIKNLPDTITTSGVNVGDLLGSTTEFVHLQAKVNCPAPTPTPTPTPQVKSATTLPNTGAGDVVGIFAGASAAGTAAHAIVTRRKRGL